MAAPAGVLGAGGKMGLHVAAMLRKALDRAGRPEVPVYAVSRFGSVNSREEFARFGVDMMPTVACQPRPIRSTDSRVIHSRTSACLVTGMLLTSAVFSTGGTGGNSCPPSSSADLPPPGFHAHPLAKVIPSALKLALTPLLWRIDSA